MHDIAAPRENGITEKPHVVDAPQYTIEPQLISEQKSRRIVERMPAVHLETERPEASCPVITPKAVHAHALKPTPELADEPRYRLT